MGGIVYFFEYLLGLIMSWWDDFGVLLFDLDVDCKLNDELCVI